ncbi:hypothetical protein AWE51_07375 [Aquimarina aggregata]|uniref:Arylesterase n=1 Tax=Aquimarina aggregata TaxID=1642818 RepID=A0A162CQR5_9FLAO|nr:SMP-30/gluconolactonase/LRE family protein [Aquimarina aggregata]KZS40764.1 hypothetical protein AWE51_07375 [Aquimarina aggregata]
MSFFKKIILALSLIVISFVAYTLISTGYFRTIEPHFNGEILKKIPLVGAEDITVSHIDGFALISSTDRKIYPPTKEEHGGLYSMDLTSGNFNLTHLTSSFSKSFAPHGISILKKDSTYIVMAVNHTPKGHSIEVFTKNKEQLIFEKSLIDSTMISPNDIVLVDENRFYFTNDHGYNEGFGKFMEEYGGLSVANVIYFDGKNYREVANGIAYANGINHDPKRQLLYVASPRGFLIKVYSIKQNGDLEFIEDIPCGTGVDNIEIDPQGNLWVGAHPNLLRFKAYAQGKKETSPSEILKISYREKNDYSVEKIYVEDGSTMSGSTVATPYEDLIITGNVMDKDFLILKPKK